MSHPEDNPVPAPPAPAEATATAAPPLDAAPHPVPPPLPSGAPYRVPTPPHEPTPEPELHFGPPPKRPLPLLGPALSVFAVMLWTFVVVGQFTTSWMMGTPLSQEVALALIVLTTFAAWIGGVRLSRLVVPPRSNVHLVWRAVGIGVVAFLAFILCIVAASIVGSAESHDFLIPFVLVVLSLGAALAGRKMTAPSPPERTPRERFVIVAMWVAGTLLTLVAGVDLAANG